MNKKVTISDIARQAGVSISSVHLALNNKSGVSEATRERIRRVAEELDYHPNVFASNLKKNAVEILMILPERNEISDHFYSFMWDAAAASRSMVSSYNIDIRCCSFSEAPGILGAEREKIGGIVVSAPDDFCDSELSEILNDSGLPLITVDSDTPMEKSLCCFTSEARDVGFLTGELLVDTIHRPDGKILVLGAGPSYANREAVERFLREQLYSSGLAERMLVINADEADARCLEAVERSICENIIIGACSVNSRSTPILCQAVENTGRKGMFPVIGSGFFKESKEFLTSRTLTAIVDKKPYEQCYRAISAMTGILVMDIMPEQNFVPIRPEVIFRSNAVEYTSLRIF